MNLYHKLYEAINNGLQKSLNTFIIDDENDHENNVNYKHSNIQNNFDSLNFMVRSLANGDDIQMNYENILQYYYDKKIKYVVSDKVILKDIIINCVKVDNRCDLKWIDVSKLTDISYLFSPNEYRGERKCDINRILKKFDGDISNWDVSHIVNMQGLFYKSPFNGDLSKWDTSHVTDMSYMFWSSKLNNDTMSKWNISSVKTMKNMFKKSIFNGDISKWNTSSVKNMYGVFSESVFNNDISKWDTSHVINMDHIFYNSVFNNDISKWNVLKVSNMSYAFAEAQFNNDISEWFSYSKGKNKLKNIFCIFGNNKKFNSDISKWDVSNVTNMSYAFTHSIFNNDISEWDVRNVIETYSMFENSLFNGDISKWQMNKYVRCSCMFSNAAFNRDISNWVIQKYYCYSNYKSDQKSSMFRGCNIPEKNKPHFV